MMNVGKLARTILRLPAYWRLAHKYRHYTMLPAPIYVANLLSVQKYHTVPGCVVECGVWRGGMSAGLAEVLGRGRTYYLFDSFEGLPPANDIDGAAAKAWQANTASPSYHDNCRAEMRFAEEAMAMSGAPDARLVKGWFSSTLPDFDLGEPIAVLRLDADWYDSTMTCLNHFYDRMHPDGIIILDDYYTWDGCSRAVHRFLADRQSTARVDRSFFYVCVLKH
jgi:O-methyltransferase